MMLNRMIRQAKFVYSASPQIQRLTKKITTGKFYFQIIRRQINHQIKKNQKGPFNLIIETTNFCNAKCMMCPYQLMKRPKKIMKSKTFEKIITRVKEENLSLNKIFFSGMGEPLTDPNLLARVGMIKKLGFWVRLYTNASLLTAKISRQLVSLKLDEINISFNGVTSRQYQKVMRLDFVKTTENINTLIKTRRKSGSSLPVIQISSIIFNENEKDVKKHLQNWSGKVSSVTVSQAHEWGGRVKINKLKLKSLKLIYPCRSLWHTFNIDSQGNFVVCCRDFESKYILGNINTHSFADVQKSPILKRFRRLHLKFFQKGLPKMCRGCNFPYQDGVEWFLPRFID